MVEKKKEKPWFVAFADFSGVNTAIIDFRLAVPHHWMQGWTGVCAGGNVHTIAVISEKIDVSLEILGTREVW